MGENPNEKFESKKENFPAGNQLLEGGSPDVKPMLDSAEGALASVEKLSNPETDTDLKAVKQEDLGGNYPLALKLLKTDPDKFTQMYRKIWSLSNYTGEGRRWDTVREIESHL